MTYDQTDGRKSQDAWTTSRMSSHDQHIVDHQRIHMALWGMNGRNGLIRTSLNHEDRIKGIEDIVEVGKYLAATGVTIIRVGKWIVVATIFGFVMSGQDTMAETLVRAIKLAASVF